MLSLACLLSLATYSSIVVHSAVRCSDDYFKCSDETQCVSNSNVCSGYSYCDDNSDETDICFHDPGFNCTTILDYLLTCDDGQCYQKRERCDGETYCSNGEDEANCAAYCDSIDAIYCLKNGNPICVDKMCDEDGYYVCDDGEDAAYCATYCESINGTLCDNRDGDPACIDRSHICDGYEHCGDGSDEVDCFEYCESVAGYWCDEYTKCLNPFVRCDGSNDCGGLDEANCTSYCSSNGRFMCKYPYRYYATREWNGISYTGNSGAGGNEYWNDLCLEMDKVCDGVIDCGYIMYGEFDGGDEDSDTTCNAAQYQCSYGAGSSSVSDIIQNLRVAQDTGDYVGTSLDLDNATALNITAKQILEITNSIKHSGIDLTNNFGLASLLFLNIVTAIFIVIGLNIYDKTIGFKKVNINYVTFMIILLQTMCISSTNIFNGDKLVKCTYKTNYDTVNWFDIAQVLVMTLLWFMFLNHAFTGKCTKYLKYIIPIFSICLPLLLIVMAGTRYLPAQMAFTFSKLLIPMIWGWLVLKESVDAKCFCCCFTRCCVKPIIWIILCILSIVTFVYVVSGSEVDAVLQEGALDCFLFSGGVLWFTPIYAIVTILLLLSNARYAVILYNVIMVIISTIDFGSEFVCMYIINVNYIVHNLLTPIYIVLIFFAVEELKQWKMNLMSMYLVSFDVITDIFVIYYFIQSEDYIFAFLQFAFIVLGQIAGSFNVSTNNIYNKLTTKDKILSLFGFGRVWFLIKSWSEDPKQKYFVLYNKHKIWDLMFENLPTVALQMYAALTFDTGSYSISIIISISISVITMSLTVWMYLVAITKKEMQQILNNAANGVQPEQHHVDLPVIEGNEIQTPSVETLPPGWRSATATDGTERTFYINDSTKTTQWNKPQIIPTQSQIVQQEAMQVVVPSGQTAVVIPETGENSQNTTGQTQQKGGFIQNKFGTVLANKLLFIHLYGYMISDFYIRSSPLIIFISSMPCSDEYSFCIANIICFIVCFGALSLFEFIMNKRMRIGSYTSTHFILKIFSVSILSSFYSVLCTLDLLKNDAFFGKSVEFEVLWKEHKIRLILSVVFSVVNIGLFAINPWEKNMIIIILSVFYLLFVLIHYFNLKYIKQYVSSGKQ